jgi:hypothetical protein
LEQPYGISGIFPLDNKPVAASLGDLAAPWRRRDLEPFQEHAQQTAGEAGARRRIALAQRVAAGLLAVTAW